MNAALILIPVVPFALAVIMMAVPPLRPAVSRIGPMAAIPGIVIPLVIGTVEAADVPWLLLDTRTGLDTTATVFLFFSGVLWGFAGWYAHAYLADDEHRERFHAFYLLAMSGNFGLIVAQDLVSFYASFALMTFSSAGLIVHDATRLAVRATSVYVILSIIGEFLLLVGLFQAARAAGTLDLALVPEAIAGSTNRDVMIAFLLAGFGIKVGVPVLHIWLPLAHPAAPTPASAVLSGVMIKAGLIGWLRFTPGGFDDFQVWGWLLIVTGMVATFGAVAIGLTQDNPKVNLAYSSISQMGIMTTAMGLGLLDSDAWAAILIVLLLYALHHSLAKGALFLGVGIAGSVAGHPRTRIVALVAMGVAAFALAGAPLTSGSVAKAALKDGLYPAGEWSTTLEWIIAFSSTATTLLMARFMVIIAAEMRDPKHAPSFGLWAPWAVVIAGVLIATWSAPAVFDLDITLGTLGTLVDARKLWDATWPVAIGIGIAAIAWRQRARLTRFVGAIPPGDIVVVAEVVFRRVVRPGAVGTGRLAGGASLRWSQSAEAVGHFISSDWHRRAETSLASWRILGIILLGITLGMVGLLSWQA